MTSADASFLEDSDTTDDGDLDMQESAGEAEASAPKEDKRQTGKVKRWLRGYGFITPSDGGDQVFVHYEDIISQPEFRYFAVAKDELVEFSTAPDQKNPNGKRRAVKVTGPGGRKLKSDKSRAIKVFDLYDQFKPIDANAPKYYADAAYEQEQLPKLKQKYPEKTNRQLKELAQKVWNSELSESERNELMERFKKELYSREGYLGSAKHKQFVADMRKWTKMCKDPKAPKRPSLEGLDTAEAVRVAQQYIEAVEAYKATQRYQKMASRLREWAKKKKYATRESRDTVRLARRREMAKGKGKKRKRKEKRKVKLALKMKGKVQAKGTPKGKLQSKLQKKKLKMKGKRPAKKRRTGRIKSE